MTNDVNEKLDQEEIDRARSARSSEQSSLAGLESEKWQRQLKTSQALISSPTAVLNITTAILPEHLQKPMQPLLMLAKGFNGAVNLAVSTIVASKQNEQIAGKKESILNQTNELNKKIKEFTETHGHEPRM